MLVVALSMIQVFHQQVEACGMLYFSNQDLAPQDILDFMKDFPDVDLQAAEATQNPFAQADPSCLPEFPAVRALGTADSDPKLWRGAKPEHNEMGMEWHTDGCGYTGLYCLQTPEEPKRTTLFVSGYVAWDALDDDLKKKALQMLSTSQ